MKKKLTLFICFLFFVLALFFSARFVLDVYFNKNFYKVPDITGMTIEEVQDKISKRIFIIEEAGKDYSEKPVGEIFKQNPAADEIVKKGRKIKAWISLGENYYEVPDYEGQELFQVKRTLEEKRIKINAVSRVKSSLPYNHVVGTNPRKGEYVNTTDGISILVSDKTSSKIVKIPDIIGFEYQEAKKILEKNDLFIGNVEKIRVSGLEKDIVVETKINIGNEISAGSSIDIVISK